MLKGNKEENFQNGRILLICPVYIHTYVNHAHVYSILFFRFSLFMHFLHFLIRSCADVAQRNVDSVDFRSVLSSRRGRESMRWIGGCFMQHHRRFYTHHPVRSPDERQAYVQGKQIDERKE